MSETAPESPHLATTEAPALIRREPATVRIGVRAGARPAPGSPPESLPGTTRSASTDLTTAEKTTEKERQSLIPQTSSEITSPAGGGEPEFLARARAGDREAFAALYSTYRALVFSRIYPRVAPDRALAEDLTSETFIRALRCMDRFTWQGRDFAAWLTTVALNLVRDHFRSGHARRERAVELRVGLSEFERSADELVIEAMVNQVLLDAVRRLTPPQREVVRLRFLEGLSVTETARAMGKQPGAIKTLQWRAMRSLEGMLPPGLRARER